MKKRILLVVIICAVLMIVAIVVPSRRSRDLTIDYNDPRVQRLQQIEWAISVYHTKYNELPTSLSELLDVAVARDVRLRDQLGNGADIEKDYFYNPSAYAATPDVPIVGENVADPANHAYAVLPKGKGIQVITDPEKGSKHK